jgi:hypothetical protein
MTMRPLFSGFAAMIAACSSPHATITSDASGAGSDATDAPQADAQVATGPLSGPVGQWTWFGIPGTSCANGTQTGLGVSMGTDDLLIIYLEGGGMCWNDITCSASANGVTTAVHIPDGYGAADFQTTLAHGTTPMPDDNPAKGSGIFDRTNSGNPFRSSSFIYIPYCTGDMHSGDAVVTDGFTKNGTVYPIHFAGRVNVATDLAEIVPSFPHASRVLLAGSSAGGYGALLNFERVQQAFGSVPVDLVDDAGPMMHQSILWVFAQGFGPWNMEAGLPEACPECQTDANALYNYYSAAYPSSRFAQLSHDRDHEIGRLSLQVPLMPVFYDHLVELTASLPTSNWRHFVPSSTAHVLLHDINETVVSHSNPNDVNNSSLPHDTSIPLAQWLGNMVSRTGDWDNLDSF